MPGPSHVPWAVAEARDHRLVDRWVVDGVHGAAVDDKAPVDTRCPHLGGDGPQVDSVRR